IERWGRGTQNMVEECIDAGLPEPVFKQHSGGIEVTFRKYFEQEKLDELGLNERQKSLFKFLKENKQITTKDYLAFFPSITKRTAQRDITELIKKGLLKKLKKGKKDISYGIKI
ncbi:MAG TPA: DeoR family transcriptional regulator, partial [bacterium]